MIDIKRLHNVHSYYPNVPRGMGKTTYCFDSLLRSSQTGFYKSLAYVTNTQANAMESFHLFIRFLFKNEEEYVVTQEGDIKINNTLIKFIDYYNKHRIPSFDGYIFDLHKDY